MRLKKPGNGFDEWFVSLEKNSITTRWTWINGKSVTIDKWFKDFMSLVCTGLILED